MDLKVKEIISAVSGKLLGGNPEGMFTGFSIDTRKIGKGDFFVPLKGENADGHAYIPVAFEKGACGTFVSQEWKDIIIKREEKAYIQVKDPLKALQLTSQYYRKKLSLPVVAVTGSAGKTSTKDLIAAVLGVRYKTLKTEGNLNNEIGLPLMLLKLNKDYQAAVLEMGMSGFGEISLLTRLAKPSVGVITNIGEAHLEMVGDLEGVARAKGELLEEISPKGRAVLNGEDPRLVKMGDSFAGETIYYGFKEQCTVRGSNLSSEDGGVRYKLHLPQGDDMEVFLPYSGRHNVLNSLAAATVGYIHGLNAKEIKEGLEGARITGGRLAVERKGKVIIINDTYNANPTSVRASLEALGEIAGKARRGAILGDMFELGTGEVKAHKEVGRFAAQQDLDYLITYGQLSVHTAKGAREEGLKVVESCQSIDEVLDTLKKYFREEDRILIKGSRGMKMEQIVDKI